MNKTIDILVVEPGKAPRPARVEHTLENLQDIVGGQLEIGCFLPQRVLLIYNEYGKSQGLTPNRRNPSTEDYIAGTFLLCGFEGAGVQNIEITEKNIKSFESVARKYGVDFALKKDPNESKYLVFFKARDMDALNAAFSEFTATTLNRQKEKPSIMKQLNHFKEMISNLSADKVKNRDKGGHER